MTLADSMRRDWDDRARKNAFYYIASWRRNWDDASFLQSGEDDYCRFVEPVLQRNDFSQKGKSILELGCGAGRMTGSFAQRFARVLALDISSEMLERSRSLHHGLTNVQWMQANGSDLAEIPNGSVDFVFSYLVLQHMPTESLIHSYVCEILRVLADGGLCLVQFNGSPLKHMNWKGRATWGLVDLLWSMRLSGASKSAAQFLGLDPEMAGKSWHGAGLKAEHLAATIEHNRGAVLETTGANTSMAWCCARKVPEQRANRST